MTNENFTDLRKYVHKKNPYFNIGFSNVHYEPLTGKITSDDQRVEILSGISDQHGNYFYIRTGDGFSYGSAPRISACRQAATVTTNAVLVAVIKQGSAKNLHYNLLNTLLSYAGPDNAVIQPISGKIFTSEVIEQEFANLDDKVLKSIIARAELQKITLVSITFRINFEVQAADPACFKLPCEGC